MITETSKQMTHCPCSFHFYIVLLFTFSFIFKVFLDKCNEKKVLDLTLR
jgi:hypothetical protein